jgi:hypothetical protein
MLLSVQGAMSDPQVAADPEKYQELAKQASKLLTVVDTFGRYTDATTALADTREMLKQCEVDDEEMAEMAREEIEELQATIEVRPHQLLSVSELILTTLVRYCKMSAVVSLQMSALYCQGDTSSLGHIFSKGILLSQRKACFGLSTEACGEKGQRVVSFQICFSIAIQERKPAAFSLLHIPWAWPRACRQSS